jgi:hypothetical protein
MFCFVLLVVMPHSQVPEAALSFNDYVIMAGDAIRAAAVSIGYGVDRRIRGCT